MISEAVARNTDAIVLADARPAPIGALERRRLRREEFAALVQIDADQIEVGPVSPGRRA